MAARSQAHEVKQHLDEVTSGCHGADALDRLATGGDAVRRDFLAGAQRSDRPQALFIQVLRYTPPFGAAAMTGSGLEGVSGIAVICMWLIGLGAVLVALEQRPMYRQRIETTAISFESKTLSTSL